MVPPVRGTRQMAGAANNLEAAAGIRILSEGGNAVDAGVATVLAAAATELDQFGLGGEIPVLIKLAGRPVIAISGIGTAPQRAMPASAEAATIGTWEGRILAAGSNGMDDQLKKYLEGMERRIKAELTEVMRDMQTELLRGFEAFSAGRFAQRP
jgi:gamma-glutamyltranspeptidase